MNYLLFTFYLVIFTWLFTRIKFIKDAQLSNRVIIVLFLLRVAAGLVNNWLNLHFYPFSDSVGFQVEGIKEHHLMFSNPKEYLLDLFINDPKNSYGAIFDITDSYWNNLRSNIIIKLLSIFDIFSNDNFYINSLFFNFLIFFGCVALYRIFAEIFPAKKLIILLTVFLLPSFLYFTSAIHRDGLIFLSIAFVSFNLYIILKNKSITFARVLYILLNLFFIFLLRNFVFIIMLPAMLAWIIAQRRPKAGLAVFAFIYLAFAIIFFSLKYLHPKLDLPQYVSARQIAFVELGKNSTSAININPLYPTIRSFFNNTPQALNHSMMRPYLTEAKNFLYIPAAIEVILLELIFLIYLFFQEKNVSKNRFLYFCIFFSLSMLLIIGYTIPILGALVRYKSIYLPLIITPLCCCINWKAFARRFNYHKK